MNLKSIIATLILFTSFAIKAQDQGVIDSLKTVIETYKQDTTKAKALILLSWKLKNLGEYNEALKYAKLTLELSKELDYKSGMARAHSVFGNIYDYQSEYKKAIQSYDRALEMFKEQIGSTETRISVSAKRGMASTYNNIGLIYYNQSAHTQALGHYFKALAMAEELGHDGGIALLSNNIGLIYFDQRAYNQALKYYSKSLKMELKMGNNQGVAIVYNNIGVIYEKQFEFSKALDYHFRSLNIRQEHNYKLGLAHSYTNIGNLYTDLFKKIDASADFLNDSALSAELRKWVSQNPNKLLDTAMFYQKKSLSIKNELSDEYGMSSSLVGIGQIYFQKHDYPTALNYFMDAAALADSIGALQRSSSAYKCISESFAKLGKYKNAFDNFIQFSALNDSSFNEKKSKELGKLEAKHEFETAETERKRLEKEKADLLSEAQRRRDNLQYSGILIVIVLLFAGVFVLARFSIPMRLAEGMVFFSFLLFFEFTLVLLDPYIERYSSGAPAIKLAFNAVLAGVIFPLHSFFERKLKTRSDSYRMVNSDA